MFLMPEEKSLQKEYQYYLKIKADLLKQSRGKFALLKDERLVGTYDTDQDSYNAGLELFGNVRFLIIRIQDDDENAWIPVLSLGLLNASV